jgi:hypothetical protein
MIFVNPLVVTDSNFSAVYKSYPDAFTKTDGVQKKHH